MVGHLRRWILVLRRLTPPDLVPRGLPSPDLVPAPWLAASAAGLHVRMPPPPVLAACAYMLAHPAVDRGVQEGGVRGAGH